jgi:hypothetical protein
MDPLWATVTSPIPAAITPVPPLTEIAPLVVTLTAPGASRLSAKIPNVFANILLSGLWIMSIRMPVVDVAVPEELAEMPVPTRWLASPMLASEVRMTGPNVRMPLSEAPAVIVV